MRRNDRGEDDRWIKEFLNRSPIGAIATADDGQPFINSNLFVPGGIHLVHDYR